MTSENIQGLETQEAWKRSKGFAIKIYKEIWPFLPQEKKWNLHSQIRQLTDELIRIINGYIAYRKRSKIGANEPGFNIRKGSTSYSTDEIEDPESMENPSSYSPFPVHYFP